MRVLANKKGFSLVELLTVIAIIAILASIIFPVMGLVGNKARMNKCMVQLHEVGLAVQMFKQDNRRYPDILGAEVQTTDHSIPPNPASVIAFEQCGANSSATVTGLFPEYVKTGKMLHCPVSKDVDTKAFGVYKPTGDPEVFVYLYNSYDFMNAGTIAAPVIQQHYTRSWADSPADVQNYFPILPLDATRNERDFTRQLKFRTPPDDTVVTWCSWHEARGGGSASGRAPVLFLDGHVDSIEANVIEKEQWRTLPKKD